MNTGWRKNYLRYKSFFMDMVRSYRKRDDFKTYLEIFLSLITVIVFSVFAIRPTFLTISQLLKEIDTKKQTLAVMDKKIDDLGKARALYENEQRRISLVRTAVPTDPSVDTYIQQAEALAIKNSANISNFSINNIVLSAKTPNAESGADNSAETLIPVTIGVSGNFPSIKNYLTEISKLKRPIEQSSVTVNSITNKQTQEKYINLVINGQIPYLLKEEPAQ